MKRIPCYIFFSMGFILSGLFQVVTDIFKNTYINFTATVVVLMILGVVMIYDEKMRRRDLPIIIKKDSE